MLFSDDRKTEILVDALTRYEQILQENANKDRLESDLKSIAENYDKIFNDKDKPTFGENPNQKTVVEFYDYNCGFCKQVAKDFAETTTQFNVPKVYVNLPVLSAYSYESGLVSQAVMMYYTDKFEEFHDLLINHQSEATRNLALEVASSIGRSSKLSELAASQK